MFPSAELILAGLAAIGPRRDGSMFNRPYARVPARLSSGTTSTALGSTGVAHCDHVFLSYSRNDPAAAANLRSQLELRVVRV